MITFYENTPLAVPVRFEVNGEPFVPDEGSLYWRLLDPAGAQLVNWTSFTTTSTRTVVPVASTHNVVSSGLSAKRHLMVKGLRGGVDFLIQIPYRIVKFTGMTCTADDVRSFFGVGPDELPDEEIDLTASMLQLGDAIGESALLTVLPLDTVIGRAANDAIVGNCAYRLIPSLRARFSKKESDGRSVIERFNLDFQALALAASDQFRRGVIAASGVQPAERNLIQVTTRADPITGA